MTTKAPLLSTPLLSIQGFPLACAIATAVLCGSCASDSPKERGLDTPNDGGGVDENGNPLPGKEGEETIDLEEEEAVVVEKPTDSNCNSTIDLILRDFHASHPDFQNFNGGQGEVGCGMVAPDLSTAGDVRTPVFVAGSGTGKRTVDDNGIVTCTDWDQYYTGPSEITNAESFADWYNNVDGVNFQLIHKLALTLQTESGTLVFDSAETGGFFPVDGLGFDETTENHNFHFTTEAHLRFEYRAAQTFTFSGDDDLWIYVNNKLALDLGGLHAPITATIDFDAQASSLGITPGQTYNMDIFHAERHTSESNFRIETNIACFEVVDVPVVR